MLYSFYKDLYKDIERPIISVLIWTFSSQVEGKDLRIAALEAQVLVSTSFPKKQTFSEFSRNTKNGSQVIALSRKNTPASTPSSHLEDKSFSLSLPLRGHSNA